MKKPTLRIFDVRVMTSALATKLEELVPGYKIEVIPEKPDPISSIRVRVQSLHEAFLFILEAYPLDPSYTKLLKDTLLSYAIQVKSDAEKQLTLITDFSKAHEELVKYSDTLVNIIQTAWQWPEDNKRSDAISCLNLAEQYVLMSKGRATTATLTSVGVGKDTRYILQRDEPLPAYYDEWVEELKALKAKAFPQTPLWFYNQKPEIQAYLSHLNTAITPDALIIDLDTFVERLNTIKSRSSAWDDELARIHRQESPLPEWFSRFAKAHQELLVVLANKPADIEPSIRIFKRFLLEKKADTSLQEGLNIVSSMNLPQWYLFLPSLQQRFLKLALSGDTAVEDCVSFLSSRHRSLPAPANFLRHDLWSLTATGEATRLSDWRYRSSHIASRDLSKAQALKSLKNYYSTVILSQVMRYALPAQKLLLQTLISPLDFGSFDFIESLPSMVTSHLPELPPDAELNTQVLMTVARSPFCARTYIHNHPFNMAKYISFTRADDEHSLRLIKDTKAYLEAAPASANKANLSELITDYEGLLNSPFGTATVFDCAGRELFLSSLEQLIILHVHGYSYGSCVSGKDRKAIELIHTDAMLIYNTLYGKWPKFTDVKEWRAYFISIVADLYLSHHQHELAGQNAPGAAGIKTPSWYMPADVCTEIKSKGGELVLEYDDRLASDNEVKKIGDIGRSPDKVAALLTCRQLGEVTCTELYTSLWQLSNQKKLFEASSAAKIVSTVTYRMSLFSTATKPPSHLSRGIEAIFSIIEDKAAGDTSVERMAEIISIAMGRPVDDSSRAEATAKVYNGLRGLCTARGDGLELYAKKIIGDLNTLFLSSKMAAELKSPERASGFVVVSS